MKKLTITTLLISMCLFAAGSIPFAKLTLANKYLSSLVDSDLVMLEVHSGHINDQNLIDNLVMKANIMQMADVELESGLSNGNFILTGSASMQDDGIYLDMVEMTIEDIPDMVDQYKDRFDIVYNIIRLDQSTSLNFIITPKDKSSVINYLKADFILEKSGLLMAKFSASAKSNAAVILDAQMSLTNIFNSLVAHEEPLDHDLDKLYLVYEKVLEEL